MSLKQAYNGVLIISEDKVSIDTYLGYIAMELEFDSKFIIKSLLPENYIIKKGDNKIIIADIDHNGISNRDLFNYVGVARITSCVIVTPKMKKKRIEIDRSCLQLWSTMGYRDTKNYSTNENVVARFKYDDLTINWEDIDFNGNNNRRKYLYYHSKYDNETKQFTKIIEAREK